MFLSLLTFPGVMSHEYAHKLMCRKVGLRVGRVVYFQLDNPVGYVEHELPKKYTQTFLITVAPFLLNTLLAVVTFVIWSLVSTEMIGYILVWLGISFAFNSFPSEHDANNLWNFTKERWRKNKIIVLGIPIIALIKLINVLRIVWFDLIYAIALMYFVGDLVSSNPFS